MHWSHYIIITSLCRYYPCFLFRTLLIWIFLIPSPSFRCRDTISGRPWTLAHSSSQLEHSLQHVECKGTNGTHSKIVSDFCFDGNNEWFTVALHVNFGICIINVHTHCVWSSVFDSTITNMHNLKLPPWSRWELRSSGLLHSKLW